MKKLLIVESPGKIAKIKSILGKDYEVIASYGHIIDLPEKKMAVDIENNFEPSYECITDKQKSVVSKMKTQAKGKEIIIATDEDREGEMIAWSIAHVLKIKKAKRIVFNSITKEEIIKAVSNPKEIDMPMVNAQKTRRILDRIVGYDMSSILRRNVGQQAKSAGRVQSVVLRLIVEKEKEIEDFYKKETSTYYKMNGIFIDDNKNEIQGQLYNNNDEIEKIKTEKETKELLKKMSKTKYKVTEITEKDMIKSPPQPYTTSTLQQEASRKLGMSLTKTMKVAQNLYEAGYITYMRTDSCMLSKEAKTQIKEYIINEYGKDYYKEKEYKSVKNTQEAHECIRPTHIETTEIEMEPSEKRLYNLIWKRTVASQMTSAKYKNKIIKIEMEKIKQYFRATGQTLVFDGYLRVYNVKTDEKTSEEDKEIENMEISKGEIEMKKIISKEEYDKPPTRYNEASLVNKLDPKNLNIGRPSTYSNILSKIREREYIKEETIKGIEKTVKIYELENNKIEQKENKINIGKEANKIVPTEIGKKVIEFLENNFGEIMEYKFTAKMEQQLDDIAEGKEIWYETLQEFYNKFHEITEKLKTITIIKKEERVIGIHPEYKTEIIAVKNYLKMTINEKAYYTPVENIDEITLENAIEQIYPKKLGEYENKDIQINKGQYGIYITYDNKNYNMKEEITIENVIKLLKETENEILWERTEGKINYKVKNGKYGNYVTIKDTSKKKPKITFVNLNNVEIEKLTIDQIKNIQQYYKNKNKKK